MAKMKKNLLPVSYTHLDVYKRQLTHSSWQTQAWVVNKNELGTRQTRRQWEDNEKNAWVQATIENRERRWQHEVSYDLRRQRNQDKKRHSPAAWLRRSEMEHMLWG